MSEIVSVVIDDPPSSADFELKARLQVLIVDPKRQEEDSPNEALYFTALRRRIPGFHNAVALILLANRGGLLTSSVFLPLDDGDFAPAHLRFEGSYREDFEQVLVAALELSLKDRIFVLSEPTYSFGGSIDQQRYDEFPIVKPLCLREFLAMHDRDELREQTIYAVGPSF